MAFLTLCAVAVDVSEASGRRTWLELGDRRRTFSGGLRTTYTAQKRNWECSTPPVSSEVADALSALVRGAGHSWRLTNDAYSTKGLAGAATGSPTFGQSDPFSGTNAVSIASTSYIDWAPSGLDSLTNDYTLLVRRNESPWKHYVVRSLGGVVTKWVDAVSNDAADTSWLTVSSGVLRLGKAAASSTIVYSDLVAIPVAIPSSWVASLKNAGRLFPQRPILEVNGDLVSAPANPIQMRGRIDSEDIAPHVDSSGEQLDGRRVSFTLEEV